ncbi:hypothetical protein HU200_067502 [Digitaria exilis]|uniref:AAA+ ATPase domain-containing protein n=1 Tax=Digitaria exilis TaxID=1010633 RepID=A0A835DSU5_9POAL|nr:hypothetical protein HU200_067502 [Digitaria exilis]
MAGRAVPEAASAMAADLKQLAIVAEEALLPEAHKPQQGKEESEEERLQRIRGLQHAAVEAMYQLDDALDSYKAMEARQQQPEAPAPISIFHRLRSSSSAAAVTEREFRKVEAEIENLGNETRQMLQKGNELGLQLTDLEGRQSLISSSLLPRTPIIPKYDIAGDAEQEKQIIGMLTDSQSSSNNVILIVGCGGSGKTTLARNVFDNHHTRHAFSTALWVRGSKHFSHLELLSAIASAAGLKQASRGPKSAKKVEEMLASVLEGKRFLLVLDGVWSHQLVDGNNFLKSCLTVQHGSRILMTTRDRMVADRMSSTARIHHVKELDSSQCWSLLCSIACLDAHHQDDNSLRAIGILIIQYCKRIPLAIRLIGGVLRTKDPTRDEWLVVSEHKGWSDRSGGTVFPDDGMEGVAGAIQVAYCYLPPHLKHCFRYCLHLPEGFPITKQMIIQLWISEGFVEEQDGRSPEDTAEGYYMELVRRSLLLQTDQTGGSSPDGNNTARCTLDGCVRSVLRLYTKDLWMGNSMPTTSTTLTSTTPPPAGQEATTTESSACFRTIVLYNNPSADRVLHQVSKNARYLRAIDLTGAGIRRIPGTLEPLLHLRFLNLSHTEITELPESIASLRNLQFLVLRFCRRLHSLSGGISKLHGLRTLDLEGTEPHLVLPNLAGLQQLTTLHGFQVNSEEEKASGWPVEDLKSLNSLQSLQIVRVDRIQTHASSQGVDLPMKRRLTHLELRGSAAARKPPNNAVAEEEEEARLDDVLSSLQPPQCLESLKIQSYHHGRSFPSWVLQLPRLQRLVVNDCRGYASLPALGQLPLLKLLSLSGCSKIRTIERGVMAAGPPGAFPSLEQLHLDDMPSLESWSGFDDEDGGDLPSLTELRLQGCPSLGSLPLCLRHSKLLTRMVVVSAGSLRAIDGLIALRKLVVRDCERLARISNLPKLEALTVTGCSGLRDATGLECLKHLRFVHRELTRMPDWLRAAVASSAPTTLAVVGREELLRSLAPGGEDWPAVSGVVGKVYGNLLDESPFFTYTKSTGVLEAFGERQQDLVATCAASLEPKSQQPSSPLQHVTLVRDFAGRITGMTPATKCVCLALLVAVSHVLLKLPAGYVGPIPTAILVAFFAATACLIYFVSQLQ